MIRLWKLGSLDPLIIPTRVMIDKVKDMLAAHKTGETNDIVWGPDLDCKVIPDADFDYYLTPTTLPDGRQVFILNEEEK